MNPPFINGIELSRLFYHETVQPVLNREFPGLLHSAALLGAGSEVLGFDNEMSTDHDWGPRLYLFLLEEDHERVADAIRDTLDRILAPTFHGYSTRFGHGTTGVRHGVEVVTASGFFHGYLQFDIGGEITLADWLTFTQQKLLTVTRGAVHHDDLGLQSIRDRFQYYPNDVWLYLLAAGWNRIGREEDLMGRAGYVGDELGSSIIASRLARDVMRLCFLMEKQYAPYPKWFGTAFARLKCGSDLIPVLREAQCSRTWQEREHHLCAAYEYIARMHNALGITRSLPAEVISFYDRPFRVIHLAGDFAGAIREQITDPAAMKIASRRLIGSTDQFSDSTDILSDSCWRPVLRQLYE